jgi:hypothetical protein
MDQRTFRADRNFSAHGSPYLHPFRVVGFTNLAVIRSARIAFRRKWLCIPVGIVKQQFRRIKTNA